jgi:hypothetical protein
MLNFKRTSIKSKEQDKSILMLVNLLIHVKTMKGFGKLGNSCNLLKVTKIIINFT